MRFQEFWDSCAQNKTSEISKLALSGFLRLLCAQQDVGNFKKCTFRNSGTPVRRTTRRKSQTNVLSRIMGLLCAEQYVRHLKTCTLIIYVTPVRRTKRQESQTCIFINSGSPVRRTKHQQYQTTCMHFQKLWDSCTQNKTSEI